MAIYKASQLLDNSFLFSMGLVKVNDRQDGFFRNVKVVKNGVGSAVIWVVRDEVNEVSLTICDVDIPYQYSSANGSDISDVIADNFIQYVVGLRDYSTIPEQEFLAELGERLSGVYVSGAETERMVNWYFENHMQGKTDIQKNNFLKRWTTTKVFYISYVDKKWYHKFYINTVPVGSDRTQRRVTNWQREDMYFDEDLDTYLMPNDPSVVRWNDLYYLRTDLEQNYSCCNDCHSLVHTNELVDGVCSSCVGLPRERLSLMSYGTRATEYFEFKVGKKANKKRPIFMGVELELEGATDTTVRKSAILLRNHAILKRDGSLDHGLEICTAPATLDVHEEEFKKFFENLPISLSAEKSCGMHVHIDRKYLSKFQIGKMMDLVYSKDNRRFIEAIAGRKGNSYCSLEEERNFTFHMYRSEKSTSRYSGINLLNDKTIELRIFNATTNYKTFMKNLEFCQALVDYTNPCGLTVAKLKDQSKLEVFLQFIKNNWKDYQHLASFLVEKGYIEDRRSKQRSGAVTMDRNVLKEAAKKAQQQVASV